MLPSKKTKAFFLLMGLKTPLISSGLADKGRHEMVKWIQKRNISLLGTFNFHLFFGGFFLHENKKLR